MPNSHPIRMLILIALLLLSMSLFNPIAEYGPRILLPFLYVFLGIGAVLFVGYLIYKFSALLDLPPNYLITCIGLMVLSSALTIVCFIRGPQGILDFLTGFLSILFFAWLVRMVFKIMEKFQAFPNKAIIFVSSIFLTLSLYFVIQSSGLGAMWEFGEGILVVVLIFLYFLSMVWVCQDASERGRAFWPFLVFFFITLLAVYPLDLAAGFIWVAVLLCWMLIRPKDKIDQDTLDHTFYG